MAEGPSGSAGAAGASAPADPAAAGGGPATGAATGAAAVDEAFAAKTRDAVLLSNPLLAQVVSFNVRDRWVSVRALEEYLKVESYAVFTMLHQMHRASLALLGVHFTKIGNALHLIILDTTRGGAQECPKHRNVAELGKSMDQLTTREVLKLFALWELGDEAIKHATEVDLNGDNLMKFGVRDFKDMGFEPADLCKQIFSKSREMNRKGGAPYHLIS